MHGWTRQEAIKFKGPSEAHNARGPFQEAHQLRSPSKCTDGPAKKQATQRLSRLLGSADETLQKQIVPLPYVDNYFKY